MPVLRRQRKVQTSYSPPSRPASGWSSARAPSSRTLCLGHLREFSKGKFSTGCTGHQDSDLDCLESYLKIPLGRSIPESAELCKFIKHVAFKNLCLPSILFKTTYIFGKQWVTCSWLCSDLALKDACFFMVLEGLKAKIPSNPSRSPDFHTH